MFLERRSSPRRQVEGKTKVISSPQKKGYHAQEFSTEHISDVLAANKQLQIKVTTGSFILEVVAPS